ncbi:MAG: hypothetical protein KI785_15255 [Devosiaceae bacterium]|nr:hypothetical protein [Devosiaceae bacterium MH13]
MPAQPGLDEAGWRRLRHAYEAGAEPVDALLERFKVSRGRLYRRAAHEGWQQRRSPLDPRSRQTVRQPTPITMEKRAELAARLFHTLEEHIVAIEAESLTEEATHTERDARALTAMARALDLLGDTLTQAEPAASTPKTDKASLALDLLADHEEVCADDFRQLLADRLDRLRRGGESEELSPEPE